MIFFVNTRNIMNTNKELCVQDNNSTGISNLPNHKRDEEDVMALSQGDICVSTKSCLRVDKKH